MFFDSHLWLLAFVWRTTKLGIEVLLLDLPCVVHSAIEAEVTLHTVMPRARSIYPLLLHYPRLAFGLAEHCLTIELEVLLVTEKDRGGFAGGRLRRRLADLRRGLIGLHLSILFLLLVCGAQVLARSRQFTYLLQL